jgi:uncharacterized HAD superfamily protein
VAEEGGAGSQPVAVVDIDGVVADVRHRLPFIENPPKDWDAFFAAAGDDPPLPEGIALALALQHTHRLVWLTGRPEHTRTTTEAWLARHGLPTGPLMMRGDADRRPARHTKREMVRDLATQYRIGLIVDDDPAVVRDLRDAGYAVRLADWLPHSSTMRAAQQREGRT